MARLFCVLMLSVACALAQTVEGSVVNSVTGKGIPAMRVEIRPASGKASYSTTTDAQGRFLVEGVQPGTYLAGSSSPDYSPREAPSMFPVSAGGTPVKLELRMLPLARISGRVVDGRGDRVANAHLELIGAGKLVEESADAAGKFDLRLLPGEYALSAIPPAGWKPPDPAPDNDRVMVWTRTYYPRGASPEAASKIAARPGGVVSDLELKLLAVPVQSMRGVLLYPDGTPAAKVAVTLSADVGPPVHRTESGPDGTFEFPAVVDDEWRLAAQAEIGGVRLRASQWIEMAGNGREGVKLRLSPPFTVRGQVAMEPVPGQAAPRLPTISLVPHAGRTGREAWMEDWMLRPDMHFVESAQMLAEILDSFLFSGAPSSRPDGAGDFTLQNVYQGSYRIVPMPPPPLPYYLDAVRVGDTDLATAEVELFSGADPISIVYKTNGGTVRGMVEKCASGPVLFIPQDRDRQWLGFLRFAQCDSTGRYEIAGVRPGEYYVLAFAEGGPLPELNEDLITHAQKVTVRAGEASLADLRAIPRRF